MTNDDRTKTAFFDYAVKAKELTAQWLEPLKEIQQTAMDLHSRGLNVIPLPRVRMEYDGKKPPFGSHSILFTTRLHADDLPKLFERANVGVIAGRLSQNLFILDCDSLHEFDRIGAELERRKINAWITKSGRGGHYWLRCADGVIASSKPSEVLQVIGDRGYIVSPPSLHPSGLPYKWVKRDDDLPPLVRIDDLDFVSLSLVKGRGGYLPKVARQVLIDCDLGKYQSWSEAEYAAALSLVKSGRSDEEVVDLFEQYEPPHFSKKRKPSDWLRRYVLPKVRDESDDEKQIAHAGITWAQTRAWIGRSGESKKRVFIALCKRAELDGRKHFRASVRELSELSGLTITTVRKSLPLLIRDGLVKREGNDDTSLAALFSLHLPMRVSNTLYPCSDSVLLTPNLDTWHRQALGRSAESVWRSLLTHGDLTREEIAEATGRTRRTVGRVLDNLRTHGLVEPVGLRWCAEPVSDERLKQIAASCETLGNAEKRKNRYADERAIRAGKFILNQKDEWERKRHER